MVKIILIDSTDRYRTTLQITVLDLYGITDLYS